MIDACDACLRKSYLLQRLGGRIGALLGRREGRVRGILALDERELVAAVAGSATEGALRFLDGFGPKAVRDDLAARRIAALCRHAGAYPIRLLALDDPPSTLFLHGAHDRRAELLGGPAVALVGGRDASPYGLELARDLGRELAAAGLVVVSGLALGIDGQAHRGARAASGAMVAVLAGGPDVPYPLTHQALYADVATTGLIVSELPPGSPPLRWAFPARNRIMAGLSLMTVVVEAKERSGSLITASFAADLGREVGAVPGQVTSRKAKGSNRLLRDGAAVIRGAEDVLDELFGVTDRPLALNAPRMPALPPLDPRLCAVLDAIEDGLGPEGLSRETGLSAREVRAALGRLELTGHLVRSPLGGYQRAVSD